MIKEYKLDVPTKLEGITLRQYQDYLKVLDKWDKEDEVYIKTKMLQIFCNLNIEDTFKVPLNNFDFAIDTVNKCFDEKTPLVNRFNMSAKDEYGEETIVEFGFIPKLDEMSFGEFIDLDSNISDWQNMHKAMVFFYRLGKKLPSYTVDYLVKALKKEEVPPQLKRILGKSGVGINQYLQSLKKTQLELTKLQDFRYIPV